MLFMLFLSFSWGSSAVLQPLFMDFGMMDVYVNDPRRWIDLNFSGGTKFEQDHNAEDSHRFGHYMYGSGMGIGKVERKSLPGFEFSK